MIKWGILGAGKIAKRFATSLKNEERSVLYAFACRDEEKAIHFNNIYPAKKYYLSYDQLIEDPCIDAIYIALPHALHKEWAIKALNHKKAVLCEKPATLCKKDMQAIRQAAYDNQCLFVEALKSRFVPIYQDIIQCVQENKIGMLKTIETSLCLKANLQKATYHFDKKQGGCLYDSGTYCASWIQFFSKGKPILTDIQFKMQNEIDVHVTATLHFNNIDARLEVAYDEAKPKNTILKGEKGEIIILDHHRPQKAIIKVDNCPDIILENNYIIDDFYTEIVHFVDLIENQRVQSNLMSLDASIQCAEILDIIRARLK